MQGDTVATGCSYVTANEVLILILATLVFGNFLFSNNLATYGHLAVCEGLYVHNWTTSFTHYKL